MDFINDLHKIKTDLCKEIQIEISRQVQENTAAGAELAKNLQVAISLILQKHGVALEKCSFHVTVALESPMSNKYIVQLFPNDVAAALIISAIVGADYW